MCAFVENLPLIALDVLSEPQEMVWRNLILTDKEFPELVVVKARMCDLPREFYRNLEAFMVYFIETANRIDLNDKCDSDLKWDVMLF